MGEDRNRELVVLLERVASGDRSAFRDLYTMASSKLLGSIRRIVRQQGSAEEALQEAFVKIWQRASDYDPAIASPVAWMTTIARHTAIDTIRRGPERVAAAAMALDDSPAMSAADPGTDVERVDSGRPLRHCLDTLDDERRTMVVLAYCQGWSREELAERYRRPVPTVKTLLRRSLMALKECLGGNA